MTKLLTVGEAARILRLSSGGVRWLVDTRRLKAVRTTGGIRLLRMRDVSEEVERRRVRSADDKHSGSLAG